MVKAGYAEHILPVPAGQPLMGHTRDTYAATGTHDPLYCKVILWEHRQRFAGIIVLDLCMVDASFVQEVKTTIGLRSVLSGDTFLISATHTHAGPAVFSLYEAPVMSVEVRSAIIDTIVDTVIEAYKGIEIVSLRYGSAPCNEKVGFYRRLRRKDGSTMMNWEAEAPSAVAGPLGTFDADVRVLELLGKHIHVCLVNYPLHPAILDYTNSLYSRDYPGYLEKALRQMVGSSLRVVFINGCCGNINHINYADIDMPRRGYAAAQRVGYVLATAAMEALRTADAIHAHAIERVEKIVSLQRIAVPQSLENRARETINATDKVLQSETDGLPFALQAPLILHLAEQQKKQLETTISVTQLGPLCIFGFPGEMTFELQQMLQQSVTDIPWFTIELADDAIGYIAHREAYAQGGYETQIGATRVAKGSGEQIITEALDLFRQLHN